MSAPFDIDRVRRDFAFVDAMVHGKPLIYLDSAATSQKPRAVIDAISSYNEQAANVHRGTHCLSERATALYNEARAVTATFLNAQSPAEIVFTRSTTEAINLVAHCLGKMHFTDGDEIILTQMEHHSNIVPWYLLAKDKKLILKVARVCADGSLDLSSYNSLFSPRTKLAAFAHASNALGTINPIADMVATAKRHGVPTLIDGAQGAPHLAVDVTKLDTDFYCFSGHKAYGPTGIGVLYAKAAWLDRFPPYQGGGDMIREVDFDRITFQDAPEKFEAGTPNIAGAIGLKAALQYLDEIGLANIQAYENSLHDYACARLSDMKGVRVIGTAEHKVSLVSFVIESVHPHDISSILDRDGVAIRAGHLCAQPLLRRLNLSALSRASFAFYNTKSEIDAFLGALSRVFEVFRL